MKPLDLLAIAPHPDDAETFCGGTLAAAVAAGRWVGVLDLTEGELGTRGSVAERRLEAVEASRILGLHERANVGLPDGDLANTAEHRRRIVHHLRRFRPRTVLVPAPVDRHPDHVAAHRLALDAIFASGLAKIETSDDDGAVQSAFRPARVFLYEQHQPLGQPTLIVDVSATMALRLDAIRAYKTQFAASDGPATFISSPAFLLALEAKARMHGFRIGATFGEAFLAVEPLAITDLTQL